MTRERAKVAVLLSGTGTNMAALLYASRFDDSPYEIVLVASNDPDAEGLALARDENVPTFALAHRGMDRTEHDAAMDAAIEADAEAEQQLPSVDELVGRVRYGFNDAYSGVFAGLEGEEVLMLRDAEVAPPRGRLQRSRRRALP